MHPAAISATVNSFADDEVAVARSHEGVGGFDGAVDFAQLPGEPFGGLAGRRGRFRRMRGPCFFV
ncbi:hypothetical protein HO173_000612 [Letharia columbiana]|uniref:Uncharacterized protein n=1 Tax=Letharia columbiana TaxID=112416 RepID=A0A8H6LB33_9LECA|nr:uncharacterized protein HO173_000612 [Letharia columbiana]KAF6241900.1 hypothetical protein HO173_000612 [Letharia columbiana]